MKKLTKEELLTKLEGVEGVEDLSLTCEGDRGYGPCGTYLDWGRGKCAKGHEIEVEEE